MQTTLSEVIAANSTALDAAHEPVLAYVSGLATHLINVRDFTSDTWKTKVSASLVDCNHLHLRFSRAFSRKCCAVVHDQHVSAASRLCLQF